MLTKKLYELFTERKLLNILESYKTAKDYELVKESIKNGAFIKQIEEGYIPDPMISFEIPKSNGEMRQIATASTASKLIQKVIVEELAKHIKFSDKSYAFRRGKGPLKAVNRTKDFLKQYSHVAKADIDNFFDTVNQEKLIAILDNMIVDKKIVILISLFLKNAMMKKTHWVDKDIGIYQGDVLSPLLSNIYLHHFDTLLEKENIDFVRFADDMVFMAKNKKEAKEHLQKATFILNTLDLKFGEDKSYVSSAEKGFEFLGIQFKDHTALMDNERLMKKISTLSQKSKTMSLSKSIDFFNEYIKGMKLYYLEALSSLDQLDLIEDHIDMILIKKIAKAKVSKEINNKSKFIQLLVELDDIHNSTLEEKTVHARELIGKAYESIALKKPLDVAGKMIAKKKSSFLQEQMKSTEIILNKYGIYVSLSKGKVTVKEYGKVVKKVPVN